MNTITEQQINPEAVKNWIDRHIQKIEWSIGGDLYEARGCCPLHDDRNPSASFNAEKRSWYCHAGCKGGKLSELARQMGWEDPFQPTSKQSDLKPRETIYPYYDENGTLLFEVVRTDIGSDKDFKQRRPDGKGGYIKGRGKDTKLVPYKLPQILQAFDKGSKTLCIAEGEKCIDLLWSLRIPATCKVGGSSGKFNEEYAKYIPKDTKIIIFPDSDNPGQKYARETCNIFIKRGHKVKMIDFGYPITDSGGKDVYDWVMEDRHSKEDLLELIHKTPYEDEKIGHEIFKSLISAKDLASKEFPEPNWVIPGIIPEGCTLLAARPKSGKSWLALQICIAVASGGYLFDKKINKAEVLYLALEDIERRLQNRLSEISDTSNLEGLFFQTEWERGEEGLLNLDTLLKTHKQIKLVIIDTLQRFRNKKNGRRDIYSDDSEDISNIKKIADKYGAAIIVIHHTRKSISEDPFDTISGSLGLGGSADTIVVIDKKAADKYTTMHVKGRDVEEQQLAIKRDEHAGWILMGDTAEIRNSDNEQQVIDFLREFGESKTQDIIKGTNMSACNTRHYLSKMAKKGLIKNIQWGVYAIADDNQISLNTTHNTHNTHNANITDVFSKQMLENVSKDANIPKVISPMEPGAFVRNVRNVSNVSELLEQELPF
jgi:hypothetical protein